MIEDVECKTDSPVKSARHINVGAIVFDDKNNASLGGWASIAGGTAFRVSSHLGLDNKVMWISNLGFKAFSECGLSAARNHRLPYYFYRTVDQVAADLGVNVKIDPTSAPSAAQAASRIYDRVLKLAENAYPHKAEYPFTGKTMAEDIRSACGMLDSSNRGPDFLETAFAASYQTDSSLRSQFQADTFIVILRRNRVSHFSKLLSYPVPTEQNWKIMNAKTLPVGNKARMDFVLETEHPVLAEISLNTDRCRDEMVELMAFGNQTAMRNKAGVLRTHASHPELLWLSNFCDLEIHSIAIAQEYVKLRPQMMMPSIITGDPLLSLSYSVGLFAELHYMAMTEPTRKQNSSGNALDKNISPRNVWLRAYDRAEMFIFAKRAMEAGLTVTGYSMGALRLTTDRRELPKVMEFALEHGFPFPIFHVLASSVGYVFNDDAWMDADE